MAEQGEQHRRARYLAIRTVLALDVSVDECADVASDQGRPDENGYDRPTAPAPFLTYPEDVDWKSIEPQYMNRALALLNEVDAAHRSISYAEDNAFPPSLEEVFQVRWERFPTIGLKALQLANDLRQTFTIPAPDTGAWDPKEVLESALARLGAIESRRGLTGPFL